MLSSCTKRMAFENPHFNDLYRLASTFVNLFARRQCIWLDRSPRHPPFLPININHSTILQTHYEWTHIHFAFRGANVSRNVSLYSKNIFASAKDNFMTVFIIFMNAKVFLCRPSVLSRAEGMFADRIGCFHALCGSAINQPVQRFAGSAVLQWT